MINVRLLVLLLIVCSALCASAQMMQMQPSRFASFYMETSLQPQRAIIDSPGNTYKINRLNLGMMLPLVNKHFEPKNDTLTPNRLGITLLPSIAYSQLRLSYFPQERLLINSQVSLNTYYSFRQKNALMVNLRAMYNEDEFTMNNPKLRYNLSGIYTRKVNTRFSYYAGGGYSYVFGQGLWLPLLGARFSWGSNSRVNILLPMQISYRTGLTHKTRLLVYARPQGGVNRFENRLNVSDSLQKTIVFRRRSFALGAAIIWQVQNNVSVVFDPSLLFAQRISFTSDDEKNPTIFIDNKIERSIQLQVRIIWRPWQNTLRNQKHPDKDPADDDNFLLSF